HTAAVTSVAISSDDKRAVTGSRDGTAKVWELEEGKELLTLKGHSQDITTVAFSNDGHSLLTGSLDGTMIVWPTSEWESKRGIRTAAAEAKTGIRERAEGTGGGDGVINGVGRQRAIAPERVDGGPKLF